MSDDATFLTRVVLRNYKSVAECDVQLGPLTFLVGPNGAGKSNFLDALRFVADALRVSLDHALRDRGGLKEVRRRSGGHPTQFAMRLEFVLPSGARGHYTFRIGARPHGGYEVQDEECAVGGPGPETPKATFRRRGVDVSSTALVAPPALPDSLYLVNAAGLPEFRPVYDAFSHMGFYNLNPDHIRDLQTPDPGDLLTRDGSNLAGVVARLASRAPATKRRIEEYLAVVAPGVQGVDAREVGHKETLEFRQEVAGAPNAWRFTANSMSDGTLRALGILVALFQTANGSERRVSLIGIEEPEIALHPAAAGALLDGLHDASHHTQVIVTSHSPELLDDKAVDSDSILVVVSEEGATRIGRLTEADRSVLRDHLFTAGELMRQTRLTPDASTAVATQARLFDEP